MEKYEFSEQDATDLADFLIPILDFVPEKRPTAAQCLSHSWINVVPSQLVSSSANSIQATENGSADKKKEKEKDEREAMEARVGNMNIDGTSKQVRDSPPVLNQPKQS